MFISSDAITLFWVAFVGTLFWPLNPDAAVVVYTGVRGHPLHEAVLLALAGQALLLFPMHFLSDQIRQRWSWLDRKCEKVRLTWGSRIQGKARYVAALSGFVGIPPSVAMVLLASALRVPAKRYLPILLVCRAGWFLALARLGHVFGPASN